MLPNEVCFLFYVRNAADRKDSTMDERGQKAEEKEGKTGDLENGEVEGMGAVDG
jgi:hypothetical protein